VEERSVVAKYAKDLPIPKTRLWQQR